MAKTDIVKSYTITCVRPEDGARMIGTWSFDGSPNDSDWTAIGTATASGWNGNPPTAKTFATAENGTAFQYYRLIGTAPAAYCAFGEVRLLDTNGSTITSTMTGSTAPAPNVVTASTFYDGDTFRPWNSFDASNTTGLCLDNVTNGWLKYNFGITNPTVTSCTPSSGPDDRSATITNLAGTGFSSGATVKLTKDGQSDINATDVIVTSSTEIDCVFPVTSATTGTWTIVVTNTDTGSGSLVAGFTVSAAPTVSTCTPSGGPNDRSATITNLAGTGFVEGATVKLTKDGQADIAATSVVITSATEIDCVFPVTGADPGVWAITVTNADTGDGVLTEGFTVAAAPTVSGITPSGGANDRSVSITNLAGTGFVSGATVKLTKDGQSDINASSVVVSTATKITCTVNCAGVAAGTWNVVVTNTDAGDGQLNNGFTVNAAPTLTSVTPATGASGTSVAITDLAGTEFDSGATVKLTKTGQADINATGVTVVSGTQITCIFPLAGASTGLWNVVVANTDAGDGQLNDGFTVTAAISGRRKKKALLGG